MMMNIINKVKKDPINFALIMFAVLAFLFLPARASIYVAAAILCFGKAFMSVNKKQKYPYIAIGVIAISCISPTLNWIFKLASILAVLCFPLNKLKNNHMQEEDNVIYMGERSDV